MNRWFVMSVLCVLSGCQCGELVDPGSLEVSPSSLDFGRQQAASSATLDIIVTNTSSSPVVFSEVSIRNQARPAFRIVDSKPTELSARATLRIAVAYEPASAGSDTGVLAISTSDAQARTVQVALFGTAVDECMARTCTELGRRCGSQPECGTTIDCGTCAGGSNCEQGQCVRVDAGVVEGMDGGPDAGGSVVGFPDGGSVPIPDGGLRVFATSGVYPGTISSGGSQGADGQCSITALFAGLHGQFIAVLSSDGPSLRDRIAPGGPWYRMDGELVFRDRSEVLGGAPRVPILLDEHGRLISRPFRAWTGIAAPFVSSANCANWGSSDPMLKGRVGHIQSTSGAEWLDECSGCAQSCDTLLHLYCLEQAP